MTTAARAQAYSNDYIRDFCDMHGECKATRDEAHANLTRMEDMAADIVSLCRKYGAEDIEATAESIAEIFDTGPFRDGLDRPLMAALIGKVVSE